MYMSSVLHYVSILYMYTWCPHRSEKGTRSSGTGVAEDHNLSRGYWGTNWAPVQEQQGNPKAISSASGSFRTFHITMY